jgi:hypothetical protein
MTKELVNALKREIKLQEKLLETVKRARKAMVELSPLQRQDLEAIVGTMEELKRTQEELEMQIEEVKRWLKEGD